MKIRYIRNIFDHWRNPLRPPRGPTQCTKCTMLAHGSLNCHRTNNCIGCGIHHDYSTCQLKKKLCERPGVNKCLIALIRDLKMLITGLKMFAVLQGGKYERVSSKF